MLEWFFRAFRREKHGRIRLKVFWMNFHFFLILHFRFRFWEPIRCLEWIVPRECQGIIVIKLFKS